MSQIHLTGELTIYQAAVIKQTFQDALTQSTRDKSAIELNLSEVTECDGAGLQLLLALARAALNHKLALTLSQIPPNIQSTLNQVGLSNQFAYAATGATT